MKMLRLLSICLLLASCSNNDTRSVDDDAVAEESRDGESGKAEDSRGDNPKGTLYLRSYIVGGLSIGWLWLGDDGSFVQNPIRGANPIDMAAEKEGNAANAGTYTKNGDVITVTYFTGKTEQWKMEYLDGKLNTIDSWFVAPQEGLPDNYKLNGNFTGNFKIGYVSKAQTYSFSNDGTLVLTGMATVNVDGAGGTATGEPEKGTYTINGNTLHIRMNNGDQSVALIGVIPGEKPRIIINYTMFMQ
ncbi:MAG: lipocalin family protein [Ferruginibacter sp.]|nr:lipocalin family protein [Chitinophagaceae bacterium]